ncbi:MULTISPECIES: aminopeptidase [Proteus]|uniref:aminopeptidase n=1 Tax=Proteus TaxID=583 RepID=UPI0029E01F1D
MENRIYKIKEKCDEILSFNMWFNLNDSFFWPIMELIDIDSDFLINLYSTLEDKYLEILYHDTIIIPVIESIQSESFVNHIKKLKSKLTLIDDIFIYDIESALFINYDKSKDLLSVNKFNKIYMKLKNIIVQSSNEVFSEKQIIETLESIISFSENNPHEYFNYIHAYWLSQYFNNACRIINHPKKIEFYKKHLSEIFKNGYF